MKIYITQYPNDTTTIMSRDRWELERKACYTLGLSYVVKNNGIGQELVILAKGEKQHEN